eukprot:3541129-Pyramimonas_sp.AAC.1
MGDLNWRGSFQVQFGPGFQVASQSIPTSAQATAPARCGVFGPLDSVPPTCGGMALLPGMPRHGL